MEIYYREQLFFNVEYFIPILFSKFPKDAYNERNVGPISATYDRPLTQAKYLPSRSNSMALHDFLSSRTKDETVS